MCPAVLPMFTTWPRRRATMWGRIARVTFNSPFTFVSIMRSQSSGSPSWILAMPLASPALLISTSGTRSARTSASAARLTAGRSRTSTTATESDTRCAVPSSAATRSKRSARRAHRTRLAPSAAKRRAHASPIPELAPVTRMSFPLIRLISASPDVRLHGIRSDHRVARAAPERRAELRHVRERPVHPPPRRRMRVHVDQQPGELVAVFAPPDLRPSQEEALLGSEAVDQWRARLTGERALERRVRDTEPVQVGEILAEGESPVHAQRVDRDVSRELIHDELRLGFEAVAVGRGPPVAEVPHRVVLTSGIVKPVRQLVTDDGPHAAVVDRVVRVGIEERRLENPRREDDLVHAGVVVRIHRRRGHPEAGTVHGLSDLRQPAPGVELRGTLQVGDEGARLDPDRAIVDPPFRIADLVRVPGELAEGLLSRAVAHPREVVEPILHDGFEIVHHLEGATLGLRAERARHILLAEGLAQGVVGRFHAAAPPRLLLLDARERLLKVEGLGHDRRSEPRPEPLDQVRPQVPPPVVHRAVTHQLAQRLEEVGLPDIQRDERRGADLPEVLAPADGTDRAELGDRHLVIDGVR